MADRYSAEALAAAREYFRQPEPHFWTWGDDAITWTDGATIVFHAELYEILRRLAFDGLPRFTPLVLLLAACRENFSRERVGQALAQEKALLTGSTTGLGPKTDELLAALDRVAALPKELRAGLAAKVALIETVFARQRFFEAEQALGATELLRTVPAGELFADGVPADTRPHITAALLVMHDRLADLDADALRLRLRTGLDQLIEPATIEVEAVEPPDDSPRALIARLRHDPELAGLGRLAHDLMAAVQVPRGVCEPEELRLGGVSDIANRGALDRLLVSELAHDDLTLAVRVAVGEALYLRREAPPRTPVRERCLLVDSGIRLWGVPRVFATAVGLALAATADRRAHIAAWRAQPDAIESIDLGTRAGLISHLEALEASPQPAAALERFFDEIDRTAPGADAILITHEDVLADGDFRRALAALADRSFYVATVEHGGRFRLLAIGGRGTKLVREAQFDLKSLLAPTRRPTPPLVRHDTGSELPAILSVEPFPLLLPHTIAAGQVAYHPDHGAVSFTKGRLMHWRRRGHAAAQLTASAPGRLRHISIDDEGIARAVVGNPPGSPLQLVRADLAAGTCDVTGIDAQVKPPLAVVLYQRKLFFVGNHEVSILGADGRAGQPLEVAANYHSQRFFHILGRHEWQALSFDGHQPRLTRVPIHSSLDPKTIAQLFDREGVDGPWAVTNHGSVASTVDGSVLFKGWPGANILPVEISASGHHLVLYTVPIPRRMPSRPEPAKRVPVVVDEAHFQLLTLPPAIATTTIKRRHKAPTHAFLFHPELYGLISPRSLRHRFQSMGVHRDGRLALLTARGQTLALSERSQRRRAMLVGAPDAVPRHAQPFEPAPAPPGVGYSLSVARWPDGSRAWLDSRGLLHLKSSDRALPELTIVLVNSGDVAAWASDGRLWGPAFYTGLNDVERRPDDELLTAIDAFLAVLARG